MIKSFAKKFCLKITPKLMTCDMFYVEMEKEKFIEALDEEIANYSRDTQAELGMGLYKLINEKRKSNVPDNEIVDMLINICKGFIEKSPECAMEFSKRLEERHGI